MFRLLVLGSALVFSVPALACNGGKCSEECSKSTEKPATPANIQGTKVVLNVTGMTCGSCANKVTAALMATEGVKHASVDHATGRAEVIIDDTKTNADALVKVVTALSYGASVAPAES